MGYHGIIVFQNWKVHANGVFICSKGKRRIKLSNHRTFLIKLLVLWK
jgi:hypothetical protein